MVTARSAICPSRLIATSRCAAGTRASNRSTGRHGFQGLQSPALVRVHGRRHGAIGGAGMMPQPISAASA